MTTANISPYQPDYDATATISSEAATYSTANSITKSSTQNEPTTPLGNLNSSHNSSWITDLVTAMVPKPSPMTISITKNENNQIKLETADGYKIDFSGKDEEWMIVAPNGTSTRIWGDPHVWESDKTKWDFTKQSSFVFGNNKATVETTPAEWNNKVTYSHRVTLHNGSDRITITDINKNNPKIEYWKFDAAAHDALQNDGIVYKLGFTGSKTFDWVRQR